MNLVLRLEAPFTIHFAQSFRKKLPFDYKKGDKHDHRNTHSIPMEIKGRLMKVSALVNKGSEGGKLEEN